MSTLDQMCCLCNKKNKILLNLTDVDITVHLRYIDKLQIAFPELHVLEDIERLHIRLICITCKAILKLVYNFKLQCQNSFAIRRSYFDPNLENGDEFKFDPSLKDSDNTEVVVTNSYRNAPLPFEIDVKEPEEDVVESNTIDISTDTLPFDIEFKEIDVTENKFNIESIVASHLNNSAIVTTATNNCDYSAVENNINVESTGILNNTALENNISVEPMVTDNNIETYYDLDAPVENNISVEPMVTDNNIKTYYDLDAPVENNISVQPMVTHNDIEPTYYDLDTPVENNMSIEPTIANHLDNANIGESSVSSDSSSETSESSESEEDLEDRFHIETESSDEEPTQNSASIVNSAERAYPNPPVGSYRDGYYPGKPRPPKIKPFAPLPEEPVVTRSNGRKKVETSTYLADHGNKLYMCKRCKKQYKNPQSLAAHLIRHSGKKRFKCPFCEKEHFTQSEHNSHLILHSSDHPFKCPTCGKLFKERMRLKMHMRVHARERNYVCDICGKSFKFHSNLISHKAQHSDERKYCCQICNKRFKLQSTLKVHMDAHNNRTFECEVCKRMFKTYAGYYRHKIQHSKPPGLECEHCKKLFWFQSVLNVHMKIHTKEKSYSCKICKKQLARPHSLRAHMLLHKEDNPNRCNECRKCFAKSKSLIGHLRFHQNRPFKCPICLCTTFMKSKDYEKHMRKDHGSRIISTGTEKQKKSTENTDKLKPELEMPSTAGPKKPRAKRALLKPKKVVQNTDSLEPESEMPPNMSSKTGPKKRRTTQARRKAVVKESTKALDSLEPESEMALNILSRIDQNVEPMETIEEIEEETDDKTKLEVDEDDENLLVIEQAVMKTDSSKKMVSPLLQTSVKPDGGRNQAVEPVEVIEEFKEDSNDTTRSDHIEENDPLIDLEEAIEGTVIMPNREVQTFVNPVIMTEPEARRTPIQILSSEVIKPSESIRRFNI